MAVVGCDEYMVPLEGLKPLQTGLSSIFDIDEATIWGWLEPGSRVLPTVLLKGVGIVVGRGREVFEARLRTLDHPANNGTWPGAMNKRLSEVHEKRMGFVEVADGRVSRVHCIISCKESGEKLKPRLEDCSSNGTFVNGEKVGKGKSLDIKHGDRISLVLSVAPLVEQYFIYWAGSPRDSDILKSQGSATGEGSRPRIIAPGTPERPPPTGANSPSTPSQRISRSLCRSSTSRYTTAEQSTLDDFQCQICLGTLKGCVAIETCGHNFCAPCLSQYFGTQLESGVQLTCPLRCPDPERIVVNETVRNLVDMLDKANGARAGSVDENGEHETSMSVLCPLNDTDLPVDASSLKTRQVEVTLRRLGSADVSVDDQLVCLEVLARLAWSDDSVREEVANTGGIELIIKIMKQLPEHEGIQCNCCLALMSLVRGEGEVCQSNQWNLAKAGAVEAMAASMRAFRDHPMVQLSALLCFIPLALENPMMQAHLCQLVLSDVCIALDNHMTEPDIQCKGLVVLGVMAQGDDVMHDTIRGRLLESNAHHRVAKSLRVFGAENDEVLWAGLFALATLARDGSRFFQMACTSLAQVGLLPILKRVLAAYHKAIRENGMEEDETIATAGEYLISVISDAADQLRKGWRQMFFTGVGVTIFVGGLFSFVMSRKRK
ncbi:hypothetical protein BSKO_04289 [Bryopsis sp. KO-2023]|nr:hypothetical protein BSKO_04289 [Bryopsis sp. KO-2023]